MVNAQMKKQTKQNVSNNKNTSKWQILFISNKYLEIRLVGLLTDINDKVKTWKWDSDFVYSII